MIKRSEKPIFFLQFYKRKFKIFSPFLKLHVIAMEKKHFFDISIKIRYQTIDLSGARLGQASNSGSESPFKSEGTKIY